MKTMLRGAVCTAVLLVCAASARADITVTGKYIQFGVNDGGSLIDFNTFTGLRFDPTGGGHWDQSIDFLTPGTPFAFYSIGVGGSFAVAGGGSPNNPFTSVTGGYTNGMESFTITSGGHYNGLDISQVITFRTDSRVIHSDVLLTNSSGGDLNNVVYAVGLDPDQDYNRYGTYDTYNFVHNQGYNASVLAIGPVSGYSVTLTNTSGRESAVASVRRDWSINPYTLSNAVDDGHGDNTINLDYWLGYMPAGRQASLSYDYTLAPVPEPATHWMLTGGLGLLGWTVWRRRAGASRQE
ncbi:PEP-CTERM sorting domain-containing protein [[Empedobacter] haloabium]|uniref:PEP-CTERM sorting domain-containing protein n=1 Tax=[Empedobacter] haloabium TaxID=592317 RepID=A0ABZ1UK68_9BURK